MNDHEFAACLRTDLGLFIERVFMHLYPNTVFLPNWHIELIAARLEAVLDGRIKRLIINVPPRSLKSVMASIAFVAWALGRNPSRQIICASYALDLAEKLAQDTRSVMQSDWYRNVFGHILEGNRPSVGDFQTIKGGGRYSSSVGAALTGRGGDIIIIDDPLKPDEALSDAERTRANEWFEHTVSSRLNDKKAGAMVIIMQRLHERDLVGHVLAKGDWETLVLPAIAEHEQTYEYDNVFGHHSKTRYPGDVLHPEREPLEILNQLKVTLGEYNFAGQYQHAPAPMGGGIFKLDWIQYFEPQDKPNKFQQVVQSWDTANKETELADYSVCTTWGIQGSDRYLLDVIRAKMDFPTLKKAVVEQIQKHRPQLVLIEDKASGTQLIQELRSMGHSIVKEFKPQGDKFMRARAQTASFEGGFVKLPRQAIWLDAYVQELLTFPRGRYDDQVDSTVQALAWCAVHGGEPGLLAYYRQVVEEMGRG